MASRKICIPKGFSLIEIVIVTGLLVALASLGLMMGMSDYRAYSFRSSRDLVVNAFERARAQAVSNECFGTCAGGVPHGVHLTQSAGGYVQTAVIFQGATYDPTDAFNTSIEIANTSAHLQASSAGDVFFKPLSGDASASTSIMLSDGVASSTITVKEEGQIVWTN